MASLAVTQAVNRASASLPQCSRGSQCDGCIPFSLRRASPHPASLGSASAPTQRPASGAASRRLLQDLLLGDSQVSLRRCPNPRDFHHPVPVRCPRSVCRQASPGESIITCQDNVLPHRKAAGSSCPSTRRSHGTIIYHYFFGCLFLLHLLFIFGVEGPHWNEVTFMMW